jgi:hypothetical protein
VIGRPTSRAVATIAMLAVLPAWSAAQEREPFERGTISLEFGAAPLVEVWNLNGNRESMFEGTVSVWGAVRNRVVVGIEFQNGYVFQHTPGAFVQGISPLVRWKVNENPTWDWFLEVGPGVSWSDLETPPRGTKFNYLFQAGAGVTRRTGDTHHLLIAYRFLHLSNNGREGKIRNPDFEMMGVHAGWAFSF